MKWHFDNITIVFTFLVVNDSIMGTAQWKLCMHLLESIKSQILQLCLPPSWSPSCWLHQWDSLQSIFDIRGDIWESILGRGWGVYGVNAGVQKGSAHLQLLLRQRKFFRDRKKAALSPNMTLCMGLSWDKMAGHAKSKQRPRGSSREWKCWKDTYDMQLIHNSHFLPCLVVPET